MIKLTNRPVDDSENSDLRWCIVASGERTVARIRKVKDVFRDESPKYCELIEAKGL